MLHDIRKMPIDNENQDKTGTKTRNSHLTIYIKDNTQATLIQSKYEQLKILDYLLRAPTGMTETESPCKP